MARSRWLLFGILFLGSAFFHQPVEYDNTKSRYMLVGAMVDERRFTIDSRHTETVDKARIGGHYYSNKAIGLPFLAAPVYWTLRKLGAVGRVLDDPAADYFLVVLCVGLPFALTGLLIFELALEFGAPARGALWAALSYGFGTIAFNHAILFSGHVTSGFFLLLSFFVCRRLKASAGGRSTALSLLAGLCAASSVLCDHIAFFGAVVVTWYALSGGDFRRKASFVTGGLFGVFILAWYNLRISGSPFTLAYAHNEFVGFSRGASAGLLGIGLPQIGPAFSLLFSVSRGLFFVSPVLAVAPFGLLRMKNGAREKRVLALVPLATFLAVAGFYGWNGGWSFGPRYLVPCFPFLAIPLAFVESDAAFLLLFAISALQTACAQVGWPHATPDSVNPLKEIIVPLMRENGTSLTILGLAKPGALWAGLAQYALLAAACWILLNRLPSVKEGRWSNSWRAAALAWSFCIAGSLAFTKTADQAGIHYQRALLLHDAAWALGGESFMPAALREFELAGRPRAIEAR